MDNYLRMLDIPENERPKEKLLRYGAESLSNPELLAIVLRTGTKGENVLNLSQKIIAELNGLNGILNASVKEMTKIKGVKEAKASQILAIAELFRRFNTYKSFNEFKRITSPREVANMLYGEMGASNQEVLKLIILNTKNEVIKIKDVFKGSLNSSLVHPREIFNEAIRSSAASIIICHNHPSGDPTPSSEDIKVTTRINQSGEIIGIKLIDHIIIGRNNYVSLKEKGIL
ncbi:DNA repair protein RadC [Clostridium sardiniense]|uniref:DNA repair protein RadC n=1 Tax=Clostridium sardiniense TaxID=29369 RepID=A0ABS7KYD4_CLOSR|nr:DNA repair protein RadC [Clostridium sardiniense]MBM7836128.1 DNA repair protein RadC [Clostridium sardiniense]MBY0755826.1 DNA repair protein RadC [Clostridium sardiniense]MDQ0459946.1 DNA repair protein RadC [Clostridium sardiniense]